MELRAVPDLLVFTFKDDKGNSVQITAPSKTKAREAVKSIDLGGVLRYDSHRPETVDERSARQARNKERAEKERPAAGAPAPRIVRKRLAYGRNDRCPCGSGKKVKRCRCWDKGGPDVASGSGAAGAAGA